jgi:dolichol kinase
MRRGDTVADPSSAAASWILAGGTLLYAVAVGRHAVRGLRERLPDRWSAVGATVALGALGAGLGIWGPAQLPAPLAPSLVALLAVTFVGVPLYTRLGIQERLEAAAARRRWRLPDLEHEPRRKTPHLLMGLHLAVFAFLGHEVAWLLAGWVQSGEAGANLAALRDGPWLRAGQAFSLWFLLLQVYTILPMELQRLRDPLSPYPFRRTTESRLRERERGLFGAHLHISIGVALAVLLLGPELAPAAMAVIAVTVFGDAASALVGIRWGRTKWWHNPGKSHAGTLGGAAVSLVLAWPFVGPLGAVLAALLFTVIDLAAPRPLPVSDNLLNPLALALLFLATAPLLAPSFAPF